MTALLGDPVFQSMKTWEKIEAIKTYAKDIHDGSSSSLSSAEKKQIGLSAAWKVGFSVIPAVTAIGINNYSPRLLKGVHSKTLIGVTLGGVAIGAAAGGLQGYFAAKNAKDHRELIRANLANVINNPTTTNAVGVLSADNIHRQNVPLKDQIISRVREKLDKYDPGQKTIDMYKDMLPRFQAEAGMVQGVRARRPK